MIELSKDMSAQEKAYFVRTTFSSHVLPTAVGVGTAAINASVVQYLLQRSVSYIANTPTFSEGKPSRRHVGDSKNGRCSLGHPTVLECRIARIDGFANTRVFYLCFERWITK